MADVIRWTCFLMVIGLAVVIGSIISATAGDPDLYIDYPPNDTTTVYSDTITVYGRVKGTDGAFIKSVTVNNEDAKGDLINWNAEVSLQPGPNPITVVATDNFGNEKTEPITVYYQAPITPPIQLPRYDGAPSAIPTPTPSPTVSISITSIPSGANVWLDDSFKGTTPIRENVTVGYHEINVIKEGYDIYSETKRIRWGRGEPQELIIELEPLTGSIYISSTPSGASVYLDNVDMKAITPSMLKVVVGPHTITLKKSGYFDETTNEYVSADGPTSLHVTLRRCGYINISSNPPGANVYLDGNDTGETTPANISKVAQGNHIINLTKFGYFNKTRKVDVSVAKTDPVHVNLSGYGYIDIASDPEGASVYLDGNYTRTTTPTNISKVVGNYSIRLRKLDYKKVTKDISVSAGKTTLVTEGLSLTLWKRYYGPVMLIASVFIAIFELPIYIILERRRRN